MQQQRPITFRMVPRLQVTERRGVGLIEGNVQLDAGPNFDGLDEKDERNLRSRMEHWIAGNNGPKNWFHGFNDTKFRICFVFKLPGRRWYGFLCHPLPKTNPRFWLCVLAIHAFKHERATDTAELERVNQWASNATVRAAISLRFPDEE